MSRELDRLSLSLAHTNGNLAIQSSSDLGKILFGSSGNSSKIKFME